LAENIPPDYFADTVTDLLLVNGVYRLTLAKQGANKDFLPAVRVFIPAQKLAAVLHGVERASGEILSKLQERSRGPNLEGETMVQMPEESEEHPAQAPAKEAQETKGTLGLGRDLMRKVAAKARAKKILKKSLKKDTEKAAPKKESGGETKKAHKGEIKKEGKKKR